MIFAELEYWGMDEKFKDWPDEKWAQFIALWPGCKPDAKKENFHSYDQQRITMEEAFAIEQLGVKIKLTGVDGTMLTKMQDRGARADWDRPSAGDLVKGHAVQIAIPDLGLLVIDEVDWIEDACTQELQRRLNEGWRILAVCPPNAARRPDYILGRRKAAQ